MEDNMYEDGGTIAGTMTSELHDRVKRLSAVPELHIFSVGAHPVTQVYLRKKKDLGRDIGVPVKIHNFSNEVRKEALESSIRMSVNDPRCGGIIIQLPLPAHLPRRELCNLIPVKKDPDVLSDEASLAFEKGESDIYPPVAAAVFKIFSENRISLENKKILVAGKGKLVGGPVIAGFRRLGLEPQVLDSKTSDVEKEKALREAQIIVSGVGIAGYIKKDMITDGVVLLDAGTSGTSGSVKGDVDPDCAPKCAYSSRVGPLTIPCLFDNFLKLNNA